MATSVTSEAAWQEAVDAGAVSAEQAVVDRAAGKYTGWQLRIDLQSRGETPNWSAFFEGDAEWCPIPDADPGCV